MRIITENKNLILQYVQRRSGWAYTGEAFSAIGAVNRDDELISGAVFNGWAPPNICMHIAADRMYPSFVAAIMDYAFRTARCTRITGLIAEENEASCNFAEHLGANLEGVLIRATPTGGNVRIYGLQIEDAVKWMTPSYVKKLQGALKWASSVTH